MGIYKEKESKISGSKRKQERQKVKFNLRYQKVEDSRQKGMQVKFITEAKIRKISIQDVSNNITDLKQDVVEIKGMMEDNKN